MPKSRHKIFGIFSTKKVIKIGTGTTQRKKIHKIYWQVNEIEDDLIEIQALNNNYQPQGPKKIIPKDAFLANFDAEPEFYAFKTFTPQDNTQQQYNLVKSRQSSDKQSDKKNKTENIDYIANIKNNFNLALLYVQQGQTEKAQDILDRLLKLDVPLEEKHKHTFNEFAIDLRKHRLYHEALKYYNQILRITDKDEHIYFNIARVYYCLNEYDKAIEYLNKALKLNNDFVVAKKFLKFIQNELKSEQNKTFKLAI